MSPFLWLIEWTAIGCRSIGLDCVVVLYYIILYYFALNCIGCFCIVIFYLLMPIFRSFVFVFVLLLVALFPIPSCSSHSFPFLLARRTLSHSFLLVSRAGASVSDTQVDDEYFAWESWFRQDRMFFILFFKEWINHVESVFAMHSDHAVC
jgi:hypothetical protein